MTAGNGTLMVTTDTELAGAVRAAIGGEPMLAPVDTVSSMFELSVRLSRRRADMVLVDITPSPADMIATMRDLTQQHHETRFVVIAPEFDKDHLLLAMQAGARHFMPKAWVNQDMLPVCRDMVESLHTTPAAAARGGEVVSVLAAGGGCGATTVAVSLAAEMARITDSASLAVDLDVRFGGVAAHLGLASKYGIADVLERGEAADENLVATTAVNHADRIDALLSPVSINFDDPAPLHAEHISTAIALFRTAYRTTVIDAPALTPESASVLADQSTRVLLVLGLSVKDLTIARAQLDGLRARDVQTPVTVVANRAGRRGAVSLDDASAALEIDRGRLVALPDDPKAADRALNEGRALISIPGSKLRKAVATLGEDIVGAAGKTAARKPRRGLLGRRKDAA